jgi:hypothetical protein
MSKDKTSILTLKGSIINSVTYAGYLDVSNNQNGTVGVSGPDSNFEWTVKVNCPIDDSSTTAENFNEYCITALHEYAPDRGGVGHEPTELKFWLKLYITLSTAPGVVYEVAVGQGSSGLKNNWWIGGEAVIYDANGASFAGTVGLSGDSDTINFNTL